MGRGGGGTTMQGPNGPIAAPVEVRPLKGLPFTRVHPPPKRGSGGAIRAQVGWQRNRLVARTTSRRAEPGDAGRLSSPVCTCEFDASAALRIVTHREGPKARSSHMWYSGYTCHPRHLILLHQLYVL